MTNGFSGVERRSQHRVPCRFRVMIHVDSKSVRGQTVDLSPGGALIVVPIDLPLGKEIQIDLVFPNGDVIDSIRCLPVREQPGVGNGPKRYGLHFIMPPEEVVDRLSRLVYEPVG